MQSPMEKTSHPRTDWVYVSLTIRDGERRLKPAQLCGDWILFKEPPFLKSEEIEIILVNGAEEQRQMAAVLPHASNATRIPVQLVTTERLSTGNRRADGCP